jgi:PHD/YefM family antitoxin component YafN of YafNO toxin-antitoxin module
MINLVGDIKSISYVKSHSAEIVKQVEERNNPVVVIQNGEAKAGLMDTKQNQNRADSINLLKILSIGEKDIQNKKTITQEELDKKIEAMLE